MNKGQQGFWQKNECFQKMYRKKDLVLGIIDIYSSGMPGHSGLLCVRNILEILQNTESNTLTDYLVA